MPGDDLVVIHFHLDENVNPSVALALRRRGLEVTTTPEVGLVSATDESQMAFARTQGRVLVTHDADLLRLDARGIRHSGVVFCGPPDRPVGDIVRALLLLADSLRSDEMVDRVEFI